MRSLLGDKTLQRDIYSRLSSLISFTMAAPSLQRMWVATYQSILDPRTASPHRGSLELISAVYATDNRTVVFELQRADPLFPGFLTIGVMRKSAVAKTADEKYGAMIGSGPFAMVGGWTDKHVLLKRVVDQVAVRFETVRDPTVRALKIVNKEIDILQGGLAPENRRLARWAGEYFHA